MKGIGKVGSSQPEGIIDLNKKKDKMKYPVITLCGSTKFKDEFLQEQKRLTLEGNIVISVGLFGHSGDPLTNEEKIMLDDMHKRKIDMAEEIFVINKGGILETAQEAKLNMLSSMVKRSNILNHKGMPLGGNRYKSTLEKK